MTSIDDETTISTKMPYETKYVAVSIDGSENEYKMAYVEAGRPEDNVVLFLHGNPMSKYLWRNIMPHLERPGTRVIAPDLIGMGESDKLLPPDDYSYHVHYAFLSAFIDKIVLGESDRSCSDASNKKRDQKQLQEKKITFVLHDWGSGLGFHYCHQHSERVKAIAFMEAFVRPIRWADFPAEFRIGFTLMRAPVLGYLVVQVGNFVVKSMMPQAIVRKLRPEEQAAYEAPFADSIASRKPTLAWPRSIPIDGHPKDIHDIMDGYSRWLQNEESSGRIPKLMFVVQPGALMPESVADWAESNFTNLTRVDLGSGTHFIQEDYPHLIGQKISEWYEKL